MRSIVCVTPCIPPIPSATSATRRGSPSRFVSLAFSLARKAVAGTYGIAATHASNRQRAALPTSPRSTAVAWISRTALTSFRSCTRRAGR